MAAFAAADAATDAAANAAAAVRRKPKKRLGIKSLSLILNTVALLFASLKSLTNYLYVCLFFCLPVCLSASLCDSFHIPP